MTKIQLTKAPDNSRFVSRSVDGRAYFEHIRRRDERKAMRRERERQKRAQQCQL